MQLTPQVVLMVIGAAATLATTIFWSSFFLGKLMQRIDDAHKRIDDHDEQIGELLGRRRSDRDHRRDPRWEPGR